MNFAIFFILLALPLRKDQSTETYLIALVNFHFLKPQKRFWNPGQRESTIVITAPKVQEGPRLRDITQDEAGRRLSFLSDIVDSEGYSIKGGWSGAPTASNMRPEVAAEAASTVDMFSTYNAARLSDRITAESSTRHADAVNQMRSAIKEMDSIGTANLPTLPASNLPPASVPTTESVSTNQLPYTTPDSSPVYAPATSNPLSTPPAQTQPSPVSPPTPAQSAAYAELARNTDYSVATIAKEANRISRSSDDEIYISLR